LRLGRLLALVTSLSPVLLLALGHAADAAGVQFVAGHLYVGGARADAILRFPIRDGIPVHKPDMTYRGNFTPPFSVRPDGSLYSIVYAEQGPDVLDTFAPNSNKIQRTLVLPFYPSIIPTYNGLAVDAYRYAYVEYSFVGSASSLTPVPPGASTDCEPSYPSAGILVYAPLAQGFASPLQCPATDPLSSYNGIAVDSQGSLYVPQATAPVTIAVYGTPISDPHVVRTLSSLSLQQTTSVALDADDRLWTLNETADGYSYVANFKAYANGTVKPAGTVAYPTKQYWSGNIAVDAKYLYVGGNRQVLVYDKYANGRLAPLATLNVDSSGPWIGISR